MHPYATREYALSLAHWGKAEWVPQWNTLVMLREIPDGGVDAAGMYPFAVLPEDADIAGGLAHLKSLGAISVVMVLDEFHHPALDTLTPYFSVLKPFKQHYIFNPAKGAIAYDTHHRRALKKAQSQVRVEVLDLRKHARHWQSLYDHITTEMNLTGLHAFPLDHAEKLAEIPGIAAIGAWMGDELVSAHIWAHKGNYAMSHLVASNARGYDTRASYAVNDFSLKYFPPGTILNFGGGAGNIVSADDGLARFKRGFSNDTAQSYLCGSILDEARYTALSQGKKTEFFPAYRAS